MFCGDSHHSVDSKNRVFLPKRFQQGLPMDEEGNRVAVLTRGLDGCLYLFPETGLEKALERLDTEAFAGLNDRRSQRAFFKYTNRVTLDSSGRFLLPDRLRELAGIDREVVMLGVKDRIEIWSPENWEKQDEDNEKAFEGFANALSRISSGTGGGASNGAGEERS